MTEPLGQSQVLNYLRGLSSDFQFHILSAEKKGSFEQHSEEIQSLCDEYDIQWHTIFYRKKPPVLSTLQDLSEMIDVAKKLCKTHSISHIHCRSYMAGLIGLHIKKKFNIPFLFDMRGFWVDERVEGNIWNLSNPLYKLIYRYFKRKEKEFFQKSDHIVSLTREGKREIESWNIQNAPITYIPTCVDFDLFDPEKISKTKTLNKKQELEIEDSEFVFTYLGSIGTWYLTREMLIVFKSILEEIPNSIFLFITRDDPNIVYGELDSLDIPKNRIRVTPSSRAEVPLLLSCCDASILFYKQTFSKKGTSPTKLGELMGMGIPVVANKYIGDVEENIKNAKAGIVVDVTEKEELKMAGKEIIKIASTINPLELRKNAIQMFDLKEGVQTYLSIYKKLL